MWRKCLRTVMLTLSKAAVPVACICILAASVMFVWAVIGVVSFSGTSPTHFGGFGRAMLTLSTATSMDGWIAHATEMHGGQEGSADAGVSAGVTLYFISYIVVLWFVMTGVLVALADSFWAVRTQDALCLVHRKAELVVDGLDQLDALLQSRAEWGKGALHGVQEARDARMQVQEIMRDAKDLLVCAAGERPRQPPAQHAGAGATGECMARGRAGPGHHVATEARSRSPLSVWHDAGRRSRSSTVTSDPESEWERRVMREEVLHSSPRVDSWQPQQAPLTAVGGGSASCHPSSSHDTDGRCPPVTAPAEFKTPWCPVLDAPGSNPQPERAGHDELAVPGEGDPSEGGACGSEDGESDTLPPPIYIHRGPPNPPALSSAPPTRFSPSVSLFPPSPPAISRLEYLPPSSASMARLIAPALFRAGGGDGGGSSESTEQCEGGVGRALAAAMDAAGERGRREQTGGEEQDVSEHDQHVDIALTVDFDLRESVPPHVMAGGGSLSDGEAPAGDFLEGLLRDLGLATQHPPDAFLVKAVTPHELHSIVTMRICGGCGARAGRAGHVAAELERQLLLPGSALCRGAVTRAISGILVLGQQAMGTGGDDGEGSEGSEASGVRGGVELSHRRG